MEVLEAYDLTGSFCAAAVLWEAAATNWNGSSTLSWQSAMNSPSNPSFTSRARIRIGQLAQHHRTR